MLKILVASSKGGCGKSTIATSLAAHYAQGGKNTAIVDADRQGSSFHWCQRRPDTGTRESATTTGTSAGPRSPVRRFSRQ